MAAAVEDPAIAVQAAGEARTAADEWRHRSRESDAKIEKLTKEITKIPWDQNLERKKIELEQHQVMATSFDLWGKYKSAAGRAAALERIAPPQVLVQSGSYYMLYDGRIVSEQVGKDGGQSQREVASPPYCTLWVRCDLTAVAHKTVRVQCWQSTRDGLLRSRRFADFEIAVSSYAEAWRWVRALDKFAPVLPHAHDLQPVLEHVFGVPQCPDPNLIKQLGHNQAYQLEFEVGKRACWQPMGTGATPWEEAGVRESGSRSIGT